MSAKVSPLPNAARRPAVTEGELTEQQAADLARIGRYIAKLQGNGFFGKLILSLQNGKLCELKVEQVLKVGDLG